MTSRAGIWALGLAGSLVAHGGILLVVLAAVRPDAITEQPMPTSELEVQAYQLDRTRAREQQPQSQQTRAETPGGTALGAGAIPQSRAKPVATAAKKLRAVTDRAPAAQEIPKAAKSVAQANTSAQSLAQVAPPSTRLTAQRQPRREINAASVPVPALTKAKPPVSVPIVAVLRSQPALPVISPVPDDLPAAAPRIIDAAARKLDSAQLSPTTPGAQKLKAALAFSGAEGDVDPVSIAAFQSFMQPGDIAAPDDQLRDGVAGLLAQVPCSRMQVAFDPDTATLKVVGHIPDNALRAPVLAELRAQMGASITVSDNLLILPRPQCGALSGIAGVGLAQSTDQITNPRIIGDDTQVLVASFTSGDLLSLDMTAPDYDAYIYLDYFDADGNVLHLAPNEFAPMQQAKAKSVQQFGARTMQDPGLKLVIGPPYGQEIAVAFATSEPLYQGLRPIQEPAAPYLVWLKGQVAQARENNPDFKGEWVYFFVSTAER